MNTNIYKLHQICSVLEELCIHHSIFDGALLGFVRDGALIPWDWDAEIALYYSDFASKLVPLISKLSALKLGKIILNNSSSNPKISVVTSNFKFTLTPFFEDSITGTIYRQDYKYPKKYLDSLTSIIIDSISFKIPLHHLDLLRLQYGPDWRTPLRSTNKSVYLSHSIFTSSNNKLTRGFRFLFLVARKIYHYIVDFNYYFINRYPSLAFKLKLSREYLFLLQLYFQYTSHTPSHLIEIGSSDLSETRALKGLIGPSFTSTVYEASKDTADSLLRLAGSLSLSSTHIINAAIVPNSHNYYALHEGASNNLNFISPTARSTQTLVTIDFSSLLKNHLNENHLIIKMDIEGLEEDIFTDNISFLSQLKNLSIVFELHQHLYSKSDLLYQSLLSLLDSGFMLLYVNTSNFANEQRINLYTTSSSIIYTHNNSYLIKYPQPYHSIYDMCFPDIRLLDHPPYYSPRNIRSATLFKP